MSGLPHFGRDWALTNAWARMCAKNRHERDARIQRIVSGSGRRYVLDGTRELTGSTSLTETFFSEFDADAVLEGMRSRGTRERGKYAGKTDDEVKAEWKRIGGDAAELGSRMHERIERFFDVLVDDWSTASARPLWEGETKEVLEAEADKFKGWHEGYAGSRRWIVHRVEWIVFDEDLGVGGMIDAVFWDNRKKRYVVVDWKRSKEIREDNPYSPRVESGPAEGFPDCNLEKYRFQTALYAHILRTKYGFPVSPSTYVVNIHPNFSSAQVWKLRISREAAKKAFSREAVERAERMKKKKEEEEEECSAGKRKRKET